MHKSSLDTHFFAQNMLTPQRSPRPRLTGRIFLYGLADIFGLTCIALGGIWLFTQRAALIRDFPSSLAEAMTCLVGGLAVMIWAVAHIIQEIAKQAPRIEADMEQQLQARSLQARSDAEK